MPKISVIMPTYNRGWIINRALDSVLNQSFSDFELLIIDDASNDNTREILSKINDNRVKIEYLQNNKGPAAARNIALAKSTGQYISYLDSDNLWYPDFLEVMVKEIGLGHTLVYAGQNVFLNSGTRD